MKTLILILVLFSSTVFADNKKAHEDTDYYFNQIYDLLPELEEDINSLVFPNSWRLYFFTRGLNEIGRHDHVIKFSEELINSNFTSKENALSDVYGQYIVALYKEYGFEAAYDAALIAKDKYKKNVFEKSISSLLSSLGEDKNLEKTNFLYEKYSDILNSEWDKIHIINLFLKLNKLSANFIFQEYKKEFFNKMNKKEGVVYGNLDPRKLLEFCVLFNDFNCLKNWINYSDLIEDKHFQANFKIWVSQMIIMLEENNHKELAEKYFNFYSSLNKIDTKSLMKLMIIDSRYLDLYLESASVNNRKPKPAYELEILINKHSTLVEEEKNLVFNQIKTIISNSSEFFEEGNSDQEKINNIYFANAFRAIQIEDYDLAHSLAKIAAQNTILDNISLSKSQFIQIIALLIETENYKFALEFLDKVIIGESFKSYLYAKLALGSVTKEPEISVSAINKWKNYQTVKLEDLYFYINGFSSYKKDPQFIIEIMVNAAKLYHNDIMRSEALNFLKKLIADDSNPDIVRDHTDEIKKLRDSLFDNNLIIEATYLAMWHKDMYSKTDFVNYGYPESYLYRSIEPLYYELIKRKDYEKAFSILAFITHENKMLEIIYKGADFIDSKNNFNKYANYFTKNIKLNLMIDKLNHINSSKK